MSDSTRTTLPELLETVATRRTFLRNAALSTVAVGALAACQSKAEQPATGAGSADGNRSAANAAKPGATQADSDHSGGSTAPHPSTPANPRAAADAMDAMHEKGVKAFPAKTEGKGNQPFQPRMDGGVKVFE